MLNRRSLCALYLTAQAQREAPVRVPVQIPGLVGHDHRAARESDRHRCRKLDPLRREGGEAERHEQVVTQFIGLHTVEPGRLGVLCEGSARRPIRNRQDGRDPHALWHLDESASASLIDRGM